MKRNAVFSIWTLILTAASLMCLPTARSLGSDDSHQSLSDWQIKVDCPDAVITDERLNYVFNGSSWVPDGVWYQVSNRGKKAIGFVRLEIVYIPSSPAQSILVDLPSIPPGKYVWVLANAKALSGFRPSLMYWF